MNMYRGTFTRKAGASQEEAEEAVGMLLSGMCLNGQIDSQLVYGSLGDSINAVVIAPCVDALSSKHLAGMALEWWNSARSLLRRNPVWEALSDAADAQYSDGAEASFLCLYTDAFKELPSIRCGENGVPVPAYRLPLSFEHREDVSRWTEAFAAHEMMWIDSGALEMSAYKQVTSPKSELSKQGRTICRQIEEATGKPTFYFLPHYYKKKNDQSRKCPGCGKGWRVRETSTNDGWSYEFKCDPCRLMSVLGVSENREED